MASELSSNHNYRVISIDMPGRGRSEYLPDWKMYIYENYCLVVLSIIRQLNLSSIDYLGTSMGGILALYLAQNRPELFNKLILNDVGTFLPKESLAKIVRYVRVYPIFTDSEHAKSYLKVKLAHFGIRSEENWDRYLVVRDLKQNTESLTKLEKPKSTKKPFKHMVNRAQDYFLSGKQVFVALNSDWSGKVKVKWRIVQQLFITTSKIII